MKKAVILKIISAIFFGILGGLIIFEEDAQVKERVGQYINNFMSESYRCSFSARVKKISIFTARIELVDVVVSSKKDEWCWQAETVTVSFSWLKLITHRCFSLSYALHKFVARSLIKGSDFAILSHIRDLIYIPASLPTQFVALTIHKGFITGIIDDQKCAELQFDLEMLRMRAYPFIKLTTRVYDGDVFFKNKHIITQITGSFSADISLTGELSDGIITTHLTTMLTETPVRCHCTGVVSNKKIALDYYSDDRTMHGSVTVDDAIKIEGVIPITHYGMQGILTFNGTYDNKFSGSYHADITQSDRQFKIMGLVNQEGADVIISGEYKDHSLRLCINTEDYELKKGIYTIKDETIIELKGPLFGITGNISIELLRQLLPAQATIQGDCDIRFTTSINTEKFVVEFFVDNGSLRIPIFYNFIKSGHIMAEYYFKTGRVCITNGVLQFHKGSLTLQEAVIYHDEKGITSAHIPLFMHHCFASVHKDIAAFFSGSCRMQYIRDNPTQCAGYLVLERSHVRGNLLSPEFQKKIIGFSKGSLYTGPDILIDFKIQTGDSVHVRTPFLDCEARIDMTIKGPLSQLDGFGEIKFERGSLKFPYKPLYITAGRLYMLPGQLYEPHIELSARNTVKKYTLGMSLRGTIKEPIITFESSPTLDEPQIMTLLLGGSEDGSLYFAMPETLSRSLEKLVFGSAESSSTIKNYFRKWLRPLENIRIVPSFSDQTGRGGVRGSLVVEVNDRWRGFIEKNFNLSEDVKFGVEYDVSDDTSVRMVRDERGDIGGEVEMRWKL